jgi:hypothetical protein
MHIDSFDKCSSQEFYLSTENYEELFVMAFDANKSVTLHIHIDDFLDVPEDDVEVQVKHEPKKEPMDNMGTGDRGEYDTPHTFRGIPINLDVHCNVESRYGSKNSIKQDIQDEDERVSGAGRTDNPMISPRMARDGNIPFTSRMNHHKKN